MNHLTYSFNESDWLHTMKKELFEGNKDKESLFNFDFANEKIKQGRFVWEPLEVSGRKDS